MGKLSERFFKVFGFAALLGAFLMVGGCGGGGGGPAAPTVQTQATQLTAVNSVLNANGTITTTATVNALTAGGATAITIPAGTTITGSSIFTALPVSINVSTPVSGVSGMPNPITPNFIIGSTAGAEDITIGGMNTVAFSSPVTINIPIVTPANLTTNTINMNKKDGNGWINLGPAVVAANVATFTTSNLCWFGIDNFYSPTTGSTGSTGSTGIGTGF